MDGAKQAKAWKKWLASEDGQSCTKESATGEYLQNRLWWAFMAGVKAAENDGPELPKKERP